MLMSNPPGVFIHLRITADPRCGICGERIGDSPAMVIKTIEADHSSLVLILAHAAHSN